MLHNVSFRNRSFVAATSLSLIFMLAACSSGGGASKSAGEQSGTASPSGGAAAKEPVTIALWYSSSGDNDKMKQLVDQYNQTNKDNIKIELSIQTASSYFDNLTLAFKASQSPDVFNGNNLPKLTLGGYLMPLDDIVSKATLDAYKPYLYEGHLISKGKIIGLPTSAQTMRLVYNKDLFRKAGLNPDSPPKSLSEMTTDAQKITAAGKGSAFGLGIYMNPVPGFVDQQVEKIAMAGNEDLLVHGLFNFKKNEYEFENFKPVIETYRSAVKSGLVFPGASSLSKDQLNAAFAEGKIGMYVGMASDLAALNDKYKTKVDWAAATLPTVDGQTLKNVYMNAGRTFAVSSQTKHPKEAGKVLDFLVSAQTMESLQKDGYIFAMHPDALKPEFMPQGVKQYRDFMLNDTDAQYPIDPTNYLKIQGATFYDVIGKLILTNDPIDPALADLSKRYTDAYKQALKNGTVQKDWFKDPIHRINLKK